MHKVLIPLYENEIAPRFDLATDVLIVADDPETPSEPPREQVIVLAKASPEEMSRLVLSEGVETVICAGIEERFHQFLTWKRIAVVDNVIGPVDRVVEAFFAGTLQSGSSFYDYA